MFTHSAGLILTVAAFALCAWFGRRTWQDVALGVGERYRRLAIVVFLLGVAITAMGRTMLGAVAQVNVVLVGLGLAVALDTRGRHEQDKLTRRRAELAAAAGEPTMGVMMNPATAALLTFAATVGLHELYSLSLGLPGFQSSVATLSTSSPEAAALLGVIALVIGSTLVILPLPLAWVAHHVQSRRIRNSQLDFAEKQRLFEARLERERQRAAGDASVEQVNLDDSRWDL